jgi:hypothetical protein
MVKRGAAPKGRKRARKGGEAADDEEARFAFLDDDDFKQQQSEEEDEEQQETAEQKRIRLGEPLSAKHHVSVTPMRLSKTPCDVLGGMN